MRQTSEDKGFSVAFVRLCGYLFSALMGLQL